MEIENLLNMVIEEADEPVKKILRESLTNEQVFNMNRDVVMKSINKGLE